MQFNYTVEMTRELLKGNSEADEWHEHIVYMLPKQDIDTPERVAGFMAQCGHESNNFRVLKENLNYSGVQGTYTNLNANYMNSYEAIGMIVTLQKFVTTLYDFVFKL